MVGAAAKLERGRPGQDGQTRRNSTASAAGKLDSGMANAATREMEVVMAVVLPSSSS
jgi:hypothetical protein